MDDNGKEEISTIHDGRQDFIKLVVSYLYRFQSDKDDYRYDLWARDLISANGLTKRYSKKGHQKIKERCRAIKEKINQLTKEYNYPVYHPKMGYDDGWEDELDDITEDYIESIAQLLNAIIKNMDGITKIKRRYGLE